MKTIWKYTLHIADNQCIGIPAGGEILSLQMQNGEPCLWVLVEPEDGVTPEMRYFRWCGTGHPINGHPGKFIGTVQDGSYVFHLFEETGQ